jgi:hypothetical protein
VTDVNEDPDNMTVTIDEDIPENNSALQNQNTENISDEEEDDETIEEFQFEQTETENCFYITAAEEQNYKILYK